MRNIVFIALIAALVGCVGSKPAAPQSSDAPSLFPVLPPIKGADPSVREKRTFEVPTRLLVSRTPDILSVSIDMKSLEKIEVDVGHRMICGFRRDVHVVSGGKRQLRKGSLGGMADISYTYRFKQPSEPPPNGDATLIEVGVVLFETDIPTQHHWSPRQGRYRVLWEKKFEVPIREVTQPGNQR